MGRSHKQDEKQADQKHRPGEQEQANINRFVGNTEGIVAQDLPDGGRDNIETDPGHEGQRTLPHQHGGELGEEGGVRADRAFGGTRKTGNRGKN